MRAANRLKNNHKYAIVIVTDQDYTTCTVRLAGIGYPRGKVSEATPTMVLLQRWWLNTFAGWVPARAHFHTSYQCWFPRCSCYRHRRNEPQWLYLKSFPRYSFQGRSGDNRLPLLPDKRLISAYRIFAENARNALRNALRRQFLLGKR